MTNEKPDRRVQRTRQLLRDAFTALLHEKGFDAITIQDVTERANVGRTTFYLHYQSKDDLMLEHYAEVTALFRLGKLTKRELLADDPPSNLEAFLNALMKNSNLYYGVTMSKVSLHTLEALQGHMADELLQTLRTEFDQTNSKIPLDVLARYMAGAELSLIRWWIENRTPYSAHQLATMLHQLQRAAICDAFGMMAGTQHDS